MPSGKVSGMRARGGYVVDFEWANGEVTSYTIRASQPREVTVYVNGKKETVRAERLQ